MRFSATAHQAPLALLAVRVVFTVMPLDQAQRASRARTWEFRFGNKALTGTRLPRRAIGA